MSNQSTVLVTGGTGKTGRRVVERLINKGIHVRVGSRSAAIPFDWEDASTWAPALQGVDAVYVAYQPDLAVPGALEIIQSFTEMAIAHNVRRMVILSGRGEEEAQQCEAVVQKSGLEWTILRSSWFNQNFSESYLLDPILEGEIVLPVGDVLEPFIDVEDIADVAAAALTDARHAGQIYELSGPRLLTFAEAFQEIAHASGREIAFVQVTADQYAAALRAQQIPESYIWLVNYLFTTVLDGRNSHLTDGVQRALGREPRDFTEYVRQTAAAGVWNQ